MITRTPSFTLIAGLALTLAACSSTGSSGSTMSAPATATAKSLYDRLGGKPAITVVVDDFVARVAEDTRINGK